jgi:hypothetical protein
MPVASVPIALRRVIGSLVLMFFTLSEFTLVENVGSRHPLFGLGLVGAKSAERCAQGGMLLPFESRVSEESGPRPIDRLESEPIGPDGSKSERYDVAPTSVA